MTENIQRGGSPAQAQQVASGQEVTPTGTPQLQPGDTAAVGPEGDLWAGRTSWKYFLGRIVLWIVVMALLAVGLWVVVNKLQWMTGRAAGWTFAAVFLVSGLIVLGGIFIPVIGTKYRLTGQRLFIARGILSQTTDQTELIRVDDVRTFKTLLGRILDVGTITILTTDATDRQVTMEGISKPEKVAEIVRSRMRALRGKSLYVENL